MEVTEQNIEELSLIQKQLKSENLEQIDFDKLIEQLDIVQTMYETIQKTTDEFQTLKQNLIQKITVMQNAILVVTKKRPTKNTIENNINNLADLSSQDLLQLFDKTETKFHVSFPSTFNMQHKINTKPKNYKSYK